MGRLERLAIMGMLGISLLTGCGTLRKNDLYLHNGPKEEKTDRPVLVTSPEQLEQILSGSGLNYSDFMKIAGDFETKLKTRQEIESMSYEGKRKIIAAEQIYDTVKRKGVQIGASGYSAWEKPFRIMDYQKGTEYVRGSVRIIEQDGRKGIQVKLGKRLIYDGYEFELKEFGLEKPEWVLKRFTGEIDGLADSIEEIDADGLYQLDGKELLKSSKNLFLLYEGIMQSWDEEGLKASLGKN